MLIILSGKASSGKDTVAKVLRSILFNKCNINYYTRAYADDLKSMLMRDLDLSYEQLYGNLKEVEDKRYPKEGGTFWTPREFLQYFGTDVYRHIDPLFWVKKLQAYVKKNGSNCIITDARFTNEVDWVQKNNGIHIDIKRSTCGAEQGENHDSEVSLDNYYSSNYTVMNNFDNINELKLYLEDNIIALLTDNLNNNMEINNGREKI